MLIHLRPKFCSPKLSAKLVEFEIDRLNLRLVEGKDLVTKQPYRNWHYFVASRNVGRRKVDGIFIETRSQITEFTTVAKWLHSYGSVIKHVVHYRVLENEFDAVSDDATIWYGRSKDLGAWSSRWPDGKSHATMNYEPIMDLEQNLKTIRPVKVETDLMGFVVYREETFDLPTLERERVLTSLDCFLKKMVPDEKDAFKVDI